MSKGTDRPALSTAQKRVLRAIERHIARHGYPPTIKELAEMLGLGTTSVFEHVERLIAKGYLRRRPRKARSLELVTDRGGRNKEPKQLVEIPVLGLSTAGLPTPSEEVRLGTVAVEASLVRGRCFGLRITGDSMVGAGIEDGDVVIVRQQPVAEHGDIVVVCLNGENTVKRLYIRDDVIRLLPENDRYEPIDIGPFDDLRILGKVIAVVGSDDSGTGENV